MYNILQINEITNDILNYYLDNPDISLKQYNKLIDSAKARGLDKTALEGYYEKHHIIPRCLSGSNDDSNLVLLTYKEHILAHFLLYVLNQNNKKVFLAFSLLVELKDDYDSDLDIDLVALSDIKSKRSEFMKGENNPMKNPEIAAKVSKTKSGQPGSFKGKHHSEEIKQILREKTLNLGFIGEKHPMYGKKHSEEVRKKISNKIEGENHPLFGKHLSKTTKEKLSASKCEKVISPEGKVYNSVREAANSTGIHRTTLSKWLNHNPEKGWKKL